MDDPPVSELMAVLAAGAGGGAVLLVLAIQDVLENLKNVRDRIARLRPGRDDDTECLGVNREALLALLDLNIEREYSRASRSQLYSGIARIVAVVTAGLTLVSGIVAVAMQLL